MKKNEETKSDVQAAQELTPSYQQGETPIFRTAEEAIEAWKSVDEQLIRVEAGLLGQENFDTVGKNKNIEFIIERANAEINGETHEPTAHESAVRLNNKAMLGQDGRGRPKTATAVNSIAKIERQNRKMTQLEAMVNMSDEEFDKIDTGIPVEAAQNEGTKGALIQEARELRKQKHTEKA